MKFYASSQFPLFYHQGETQKHVDYGGAQVLSPTFAWFARLSKIVNQKHNRTHTSLFSAIVFGDPSIIYKPSNCWQM